MNESMFVVEEVFLKFYCCMRNARSKCQISHCFCAASYSSAREKVAHGDLDMRLAFEEHWKGQIQDPRNIEHFFQVWIMEGNSGSGVVYMGPGP